MSKILLEFTIKPERITLDHIYTNAEQYANHEDFKDWAMREYVFLKDIQNNILDKHLNIQQLIESMLHDTIDDYVYGGNVIDLTHIVKEHCNQLEFQTHTLRLLDAIEKNLVAENIEPLFDCYKIEMVKNKGTLQRVRPRY